MASRQARSTACTDVVNPCSCDPTEACCNTGSWWSSHVHAAQPRLRGSDRLQWPASYKAGARAWTAEQYANKVRGMAEALVAAKAAGMTVHWVRLCCITQV